MVRVVEGVTCDHILDKVRVSRAVGVGVVSGVGGVLDVGDVNGDASVSLLRSVVYGPVVSELGQLAILAGQHLGDGSCEGGFAVIHMTDGANVAVRLVPLEYLLLEDDTADTDVPPAGEGERLGGYWELEGGGADVL